ncbi:MAG: ribbon-helix-helix protein, CopG family [Ilumatobacteraceae bacterium]|nr:ribbon-helix-helix protein, CopG family [Ilumatobacteraceae bacterium]
MKVSVSLPDDDVDFLDSYADRAGFASRSAVVHKAVRLLRASELGAAYEDAWTTWEASDDSALWDATASDGQS